MSVFIFNYCPLNQGEGLSITLGSKTIAPMKYIEVTDNEWEDIEKSMGSKKKLPEQLYIEKVQADSGDLLLEIKRVKYECIRQEYSTIKRNAQLVEMYQKRFKDIEHRLDQYDEKEKEMEQDQAEFEAVLTIQDEAMESGEKTLKVLYDELQNTLKEIPDQNVIRAMDLLANIFNLSLQTLISTLSVRELL